MFDVSWEKVRQTRIPTHRRDSISQGIQNQTRITVTQLHLRKKL